MINSEKIIIELLDKNLDDLSILLLNDPNTITFGASETDKEQDIEIGKSIFEELLSSIKDKLCTDPRLKNICSSEEYKENSEVILSVLDIILASMNAVPVLVATAMVLKYGLKRICNEE